MQVEHSNMLSRGWHVITRAQPEWWHFNRGTTLFECSTSKRASSVLSYDQLRASTKSRGRMHDTVLSTKIDLRLTIWMFHLQPCIICIMLFITPTKEDNVFVVVCLVGCLLATLRKNFRTDLPAIFREGWQWASEQTLKFRWRSGSPPGWRDCFRIRHCWGFGKWLTGINLLLIQIRPMASLRGRALAEVCTVPVLLVYLLNWRTALKCSLIVILTRTVHCESKTSHCSYSCPYNFAKCLSISWRSPQFHSLVGCR